MKQLLFLLLLTTITATAHAEKNAKVGKVKHAKAMQQPAADTALHGTGKEHYEYGARNYDPRTARHGHVDIDSATAAKYRATRPTLPKRNNEPQAK